MDRSRLILIILVTIGIAGGSYEFVARYQENARRRVALEEAQRKAAAEAEKQAQIKAEAEKKKAAEAARAEEARKLAEQGRPTGTTTQEPPPGEVVIGTPKSLPGLKPASTPAPLRPLMDAPPPPDKPVPVIPVAEKWIVENQLNSTLMGVPRLAVINKLEFQQGQRVALPGGLFMQLAQIEDGYVVFEAEGYRFKMRMKTVKD